ncbi:MAG: glycoside hydrolase family 127 protein [Bacteroidales bacterium]|nr:glycoside hydrolase family 127 protein [Bacteroidales bacterium]
MRRLLLSVSFLTVALAFLQARPALTVDDALKPAESRFSGYLGGRIDGCVENRLMAQDLERLLFAFRDKSDGKWGFRTEFWGKWFTAAMMGYDYSPTPEHKAVVDAAVKGLIATQGEDGYIGTYPDEYHLGDWDVWGRKYTLLGLLAYYDRTGDASVLEAACRAADHLIREVGPDSGVNIAETGWIGWKGLAPSSVLEPVVLLYQRTGEARYLEFAEHIVKCWSSPNKLTPTGIHLIEEALSDKPMWKMSGAPKAYEMMSCFEGLLELYRCTGNKEYRKAVLNLIRKIERDELMIVGSGSAAEIWFHGKLHQSDPIYQGMETCVTATWMKLLYQALRLTGDSHYADLLEQSLYNAMLSSMTPNGEWFSYYTGLMGERVYSHLQFPDVVMSCCVANGPRGLMTTPSWAVMYSEKGPVVNLYSALETSVKTPAGQELSLKVEGNYPVEDKAAVILRMDRPERFTLRLRIPEWSRKTVVSVGEKRLSAKPGKYLKIRRKWNPGDCISVVFDFRARVLDAPNGTGDEAIRRGPVVLAFDTRLIPRRDGVDEPPMYRYEFDRKKDGSIDVRLVESPDPALWMTFEVPCVDEAGAPHTLPMCDYASAGNTWQEGNLFRVWTPQPFDFRHLYVNNLDWHVNTTVGVPRPEIPEMYRVE